MRRLRVLLDANVIVNAQVRDLICRLAEAELLDVRWSAAILEETRRALVEGLGLDPSKVDRLLDALGRAFPAAPVEGFEGLIDQLDLPDLDDRHVLAAAIHGECDLLVTDNVRDFPSATMERFDILASSAGQFGATTDTCVIAASGADGLSAPGPRASGPERIGAQQGGLHRFRLSMRRPT